MTEPTAPKTDTHSLIASDRVESTAVYNTKRERLGTIQNVMIDKQSGHAEYAVMSFGGFLGIGEDHYPIPWQKLSYDVDAGGYLVDIDRATLEKAPHYAPADRPDFDRIYSTQIGSYYGF